MKGPFLSLPPYLWGQSVAAYFTIELQYFHHNRHYHFSDIKQLNIYSFFGIIVNVLYIGNGLIKRPVVQKPTLPKPGQVLSTSIFHISKKVIWGRMFKSPGLYKSF